MTGSPFTQTIDIGREMHQLIKALFPLHRSIAGPGVQATLEQIQQYLPLEIHSVPSGTRVFDWVVPREWHLRDAYIRNDAGERIVDVNASNLHVMNHSMPVQRRMTLAELQPHLATLPTQPDLIPYRTVHMQEKWGFCLTQHQLDAMAQQPADTLYEVCIDAEFVSGALRYGEYFIPGESEAEVLISCNICHPSLANDGLSGVAVATYLARELRQHPRRLGYRFIFIPATIGAIAWLSVNREHLARIRHGLILQVTGDAGHSTYKQSRRGDAEMDRAAAHVLKMSGAAYEIRDFEPFGYDERQFCSPGINLALGCLMRTPNGEYPEYHTSADNLDLVRPESLADTFDKCRRIFDILENNGIYLNQNPMCEPRLGKWGLYSGYGSDGDGQELQKAVQWTLNLSDGTHSLLDIAERADMPFDLIRRSAEALCECGLLRAKS